MKSYLRVLVAQKELQDGRRLGLRTIAKESGASVSTVVGLDNNTLKRAPLEEVAKLCRYFDCDLCDLLKLEEE